MKSLTAKTFTTAIALGAALLGTVGTSHAAEGVPDYGKVVGVGYSTSERTAISNAFADASGQCASGTALGRPDAVVKTEKWINDWKATFTTTCLPAAFEE